MLTFRLPSVTAALLIASVGCAAAATSQPDPAKTEPGQVNLATMAPIEFYLAKGEADACGSGCNVWIVAEGKIDAGAASRLRRLLTKLGRPRPPIYFHSPGGSVIGGIELGRLIREQKLEVSVGHTISPDCDQGKPAEKSCEAQKRSGEAIASEIDPLRYQCNSSCVIALAGGTVRHVPPMVKLGIHDVGLDPDKAPPPGVTVRQVKAVARERIRDYWRDMGIDDALFKTASAIPFESQRLIGRDEIVRFGIDRSASGEAGWELVNNPTPALIKRFFARADSDLFQHIEGLLIANCGSGGVVRMGFMREHADSDAAANWRSLSLSVNGQRFNLLGPIQAGKFDMRAASLPSIALEAASDSGPLELSGTYLGRNEETTGKVTLSMRGFPVAYAKLRKGCDAAARTASNAWLRQQDAAWLSPKPAPSADVFSIGKLSLPPPNSVPAGLTQSAANTAGAPAQSEPAHKACGLQLAGAPEHLTGRVTGLLSDEEALAETRKAEAELGAEISPAYVTLKRATVERDPGTDNRSTTAVIPEHMAVKIGDLVELIGRRRDRSLPCHFIPWTIIGRRMAE
jgi:hypothetical protein